LQRGHEDTEIKEGILYTHLENYKPPTYMSRSIRYGLASAIQDGSIDGIKLANGAITDAKVSASAAIQKTKLSGLAFGGSGSDGVLNVTTGTTNIDLGGALVKTLNYTSINVSVGATLGFINPHASGTVIQLKSQGAVTIAGTVLAKGMGAAGGAAGGVSGAGGVGTGISTTHAIYSSSVLGGAGGGIPGGAGGAAGAALTPTGAYSVSSYIISTKGGIFLVPGAGGAGGAGSNSVAGGAGGNGGAALYIECNGAWNFTGSIDISGANGSAGTASGSVGGSGGGGGAPGTMLALYVTLTASSGTVVNTGGTGGAAGTGPGGGTPGGSGGGAGGFLGAGAAGTAVSTGTNSGTGGGSGGCGAVGGSAGGTGATTSATTYLIMQNAGLYV
jgi:hypothetical protein